MRHTGQEPTPITTQDIARRTTVGIVAAAIVAGPNLLSVHTAEATDSMRDRPRPSHDDKAPTYNQELVAKTKIPSDKWLKSVAASLDSPIADIKPGQEPMTDLFKAKTQTSEGSIEQGSVVHDTLPALFMSSSQSANPVDHDVSISNGQPSHQPDAQDSGPTLGNDWVRKMARALEEKPQLIPRPIAPALVVDQLPIDATQPLVTSEIISQEKVAKPLTDAEKQTKSLDSLQSIDDKWNIRVVIIKHLMQYVPDMNLITAFAFVANFEQETGGSLKSSQKQFGGGPGRGLAQWENVRLVALKKFAQERNTTWDDFQTQLDFIVLELTTKGLENHSYKKILAAGGDLETQTDAVRKYYERPGKLGTAARYAYAVKIKSAYDKAYDGLAVSVSESSAPNPVSIIHLDSIKSLAKGLMGDGSESQPKEVFSIPPLSLVPKDVTFSSKPTTPTMIDLDTSPIVEVVDDEKDQTRDPDGKSVNIEIDTIPVALQTAEAPVLTAIAPEQQTQAPVEAETPQELTKDPSEKWKVNSNHKGSIDKKSSEWQQWKESLGTNGNTNAKELVPIDVGYEVAHQANRLNKHGGGNKFHPNAARSLEAMIVAFNEAFPGTYLTPGASFRSEEAQDIAWKNFQKGGNEAAKPKKNKDGKVEYTSNHGWGLATDMRVSTVKGEMGVTIQEGIKNFKEYYGWIRKNGPEFGWVNPHSMRPEVQKNKKKREPWHLVYVGSLTIEDQISAN